MGRGDAEDLMEKIKDLTRSGDRGRKDDRGRDNDRDSRNRDGSANQRGVGRADRWSVREVADWVKKQGFKCDALLFEDKRVDGEMLCKMTSRKLMDELRMGKADAEYLMKKIHELDGADKYSGGDDRDRRRG